MGGHMQPIGWQDPQTFSEEKMGGLHRLDAGKDQPPAAARDKETRIVMIPEKKFIEIAKGLLEKTRKSEVAWTPEANQPSAFYVALPKSTVRLCFLSPSADLDKI